ncbi:hypothetical protein PG985_011048 [Apiospora marii]|uniref:uncharacterized protein n=1 Tax=Apiospora marii TaxID=335849 RepID=UPI0031320C53
MDTKGREPSRLGWENDHYISPASKSSEEKMPQMTVPIPPYFWGQAKELLKTQPRVRGYSQSRELVGHGTLADFERLMKEALEYVKRVFEDIGTPESRTDRRVVSLRLSDELSQWRAEQHAAGRILPSKGNGLKQASPEIIELFNAEQWPKPLVTCNALFGSGWANLHIGAYDALTLYSNYCLDVGFYYEHGYSNVFPEFETVIKAASVDDRALSTPLGRDRKAATHIGLEYIRGKADLETAHAAHLGHRTARMDRRTALVVCFAEASLAGLVYEAVGRGFDPAGALSDAVFSSPGTDVLDVGSDLLNSEILNSFLNTADVADAGVVTEEALRRAYEAYAHAGARMFTERWHEPTAKMNAQLYVWHMVNDRHCFLRRAVLGYSRVRLEAKAEGPPQQREGDFDEVFDEGFRTTGFSRPLEGACDGRETCDQVAQLLDSSSSDKNRERLANLWYCISITPLHYAAAGIVDAGREEELVGTQQQQMAEAYHLGLIQQMAWLVSHASQHAWHVNYLMEAAMFGSLLDDGGLAGKLDRTD